MIFALRYMSNNINQIAKRLNETGRAYDSDFYDIQKRQDELWVKANESSPSLRSYKLFRIRRSCILAEVHYVR
jgi:hypothetical protein